MWDILPVEVLTVIFSHLNINDRLRAGLVCKKWLTASSAPELLEDILVVIKKTFSEQFKKCNNLTRPFTSFRFEEVSDSTYLGFLDKHCKQLTYLAFVSCFDDDTRKMEKCCDGGSDDPIPTLTCPKLKHLSVVRGPEWSLFSHLPVLKSLFLWEPECFKDDGFVLLDDVVPLTLQDLRVSFRELCGRPVYCRFYPPPPASDLQPETNVEDYAMRLMEEKPSIDILSYLALEKFKSKRAKSLKSFSCHLPLIKPKKYLDLFSDLELERLHMAHQTSTFTYSFLLRVTFTHVTTLSLWNSLVDDKFFVFLKGATTFVDVELVMEPNLTNAAKILFSMPNLRRIRIERCKRIHPNSYLDLFAMEYFKSKDLTDVCLCHEEMSPNAMASLLQQLNPKLLTRLRLSCPGILNSNLEYICKNFKKLQYLNLSGCVDLTKEGIKYALPDLKLLQRLVLPYNISHEYLPDLHGMLGNNFTFDRDEPVRMYEVN